jgi:hypothetical protein
MQPLPRSLLPRASSLLGRRRVQLLAWGRRVNLRTSCPVRYLLVFSDSPAQHFTGAGVPCVPGYHGETQDPDFLFEKAQEIGNSLTTIV